MGDEARPRLRDVDHDAPDGLTTNDVFDRGSVEAERAGATDHAPAPRGHDASAEADE